MKPRVFIGSSVENLDIANTLQANLDYDGNITVWNQGVFNLSSDALTDLLKALDHFNFAIFVFQPNDMTVMREIMHNTVRDNVIFELGLFIGRLGKDRVYYLVPRSINIHLPSDLIGMSPGLYDDKREDGNLSASLGPFCQQVRANLKSYIVENLSDLVGESENVKKIVVNKTPYWEFELASVLFESKLESINLSSIELNNDQIVQRKKKVNYKEVYKFIIDSLSTYESFASQFKKCLEELTKAFRPPGTSGNVLEIKKAVDHTILICKELIAWEYELNSMEFPDGLENIKSLMRGWSNIFLKDINTIAPQIRQMVVDDKLGLPAKPIELVLSTPESMTEAAKHFSDYIINNGITDLEN